MNLHECRVLPQSIKYDFDHECGTTWLITDDGALIAEASIEWRHAYQRLAAMYNRERCEEKKMCAEGIEIKSINPGSGPWINVLKKPIKLRPGDPLIDAMLADFDESSLEDEVSALINDVKHHRTMEPVHSHAMKHLVTWVDEHVAEVPILDALRAYVSDCTAIADTGDLGALIDKITRIETFPALRSKVIDDDKHVMSAVESNLRNMLEATQHMTAARGHLSPEMATRLTGAVDCDCGVLGLLLLVDGTPALPAAREIVDAWFATRKFSCTGTIKNSLALLEKFRPERE